MLYIIRTTPFPSGFNGPFCAAAAVQNDYYIELYDHANDFLHTFQSNQSRASAVAHHTLSDTEFEIVEKQKNGSVTLQRPVMTTEHRLTVSWTVEVDVDWKGVG